MNIFFKITLLVILGSQIACSDGYDFGGGRNVQPLFYGPDQIDLIEGQELNLQLSAFDPEGQPISFSISGGEDSHLFQLTPSGVLSFVNLPDINMPADFDVNNQYEVDISATDGVNETTHSFVVSFDDGMAVNRDSDSSPLATDDPLSTDGTTSTDASNSGNSNADSMDDPTSTDASKSETSDADSMDDPTSTDASKSETSDADSMDDPTSTDASDSDTSEPDGASDVPDTADGIADDGTGDGADDGADDGGDAEADAEASADDGVSVEIEGQNSASSPFRVGNTLSVTIVDPEDSVASTPAYSWYFTGDDGHRYDLAAGNDYDLMPSDVSREIQVEVTYNNTEGDPVTVTSNATQAILSNDFNISLQDINFDIGFKINRDDNSNQSFDVVSDAGDINGDGIGDVIIGVPHGDGDGEGTTYVVYGTNGSRDSDVNLDSLANNSSVGFKINGTTAGEYSGSAVSNAGDINGDGIGDLIIGALGADTVGDESYGVSYVLFGQIGNSRSTEKLSDLVPGEIGFKINGETLPGRSGFSVSGGGDFNGDGFDDVIIGARFASLGGSDLVGRSYVVWGQKDNRADNVGLDSYTYVPTATSLTMFGGEEGDNSGWSVSSAGDFNGDGYDDVIVGSPWADPDSDDNLKGISYLVYGAPPTVNVNVKNSDRVDRFIGERSGDMSGHSVSGAGDVNGDGYDDVIIGAQFARPDDEDDLYDSGASYVIYGRERDFGSVRNVIIELDALHVADGFKIVGASQDDLSGSSVSGAGDVNGDGYDDVIIGAIRAEPNLAATDDNNGVSYVVYGQGGKIRDEINLSDFHESEYDHTDGFKINGARVGDSSGYSVSSAGDINNDGFDDLIIGSSRALATYVAYGAASNYSWVESNDVNAELDGITKAGGIDEDGTLSLVGSHGHDTLTWNGAEAVLIGGAGDDTLIINDSGFDRIDGGHGTDTLRLGNKLSLNFTDDEWRKNRITGIEVIDMAATESTLTLMAIDVLNISDTSNTLKVAGNNDDILVLEEEGWTRDLTTGFWENGLAKIELVLSGDYAPRVRQSCSVSAYCSLD